MGESQNDGYNKTKQALLYWRSGKNEGMNISVLLHWKQLQNNHSFKNTEMDEERIKKRKKVNQLLERHNPTG